MTFKGKFILWCLIIPKIFYIVDTILKVCINVYMIYMYRVLHLLAMFAVIAITMCYRDIA